MEGLRLQPLVESRDPYLAALGKKKDGQSERLPNKGALSKRAAKGARIVERLLLHKIVQVHSAQQVGSFHNFQMLQCPGWLHSSKDPLHDMQPTVPFSWPTPPGSQTGKPYPGIKPARGKICLQQLQMQSIEAYTCVLGALVQARGDRHSSWEAGNSSFLPPVTNTTPL